MIWQYTVEFCHPGKPPGWWSQPLVQRQAEGNEVWMQDPGEGACTILKAIRVGLDPRDGPMLSGDESYLFVHQLLPPTGGSALRSTS